MRIICIFLVVFFLCWLFVAGRRTSAVISIGTTPASLSRTIDVSDLQAGAGTDLNPDYYSAANAISIDVSGTTGIEDQWRVDVRKVDTTWHSNLHLHTRRTSDGDASPANISGGSSYQEMSGTDQQFFTGEGDIIGIEAQLKLSGVSVQIPPNTYSTTVYFTVVDI